MSATPLVAYLVCNSPDRNHDCDFARVRLAQALYDAGGIWTDVGMSYADTARLDAVDLLVTVTYTAGLQVSDAECQALLAGLESPRARKKCSWRPAGAARCGVGRLKMPCGRSCTASAQVTAACCISDLATRTELSRRQARRCRTLRTGVGPGMRRCISS